ncbi:hypothetical protein BaRGS_00012670 [Batillaria attramentaria]|uniref:Secreted protein n=1 Tax=Batillaria attramentaria TaxID=370345 RepID=A0ABD0LA07_9CAEN
MHPNLSTHINVALLLLECPAYTSNCSLMKLTQGTGKTLTSIVRGTCEHEQTLTTVKMYQWPETRGAYTE